MVLKNKPIFLIALAICLAATACTGPEADTVCLTARLPPYGEGGGKVQIDDGLARWSRVGEEMVNVNGTAYEVAYTGEGSAVISDIARNEAGYTVVYPASAVRSAVSGTADITLHLDSIQPYRTLDGVQQIVAPMAAHTVGTTVGLANLCSVVRLTVSNTEEDSLTMKYIRISSSAAILSGDGTLSLDGTPTLTMNAGGGHAVRLDFSPDRERLGPGQSRTYSLVLPPFAEADLRITLGANTSGSNYGWSAQSPATALPASWVVAAPSADGGLAARPLEGEGTEADPYRIGNSNDLGIMAQRIDASAAYASAHYRLLADIKCSEHPLQAIGNHAHPFAGTLDGGGHTIILSSITPYAYELSDHTTLEYGLVAEMEGGLIKDVNAAGTVVIDTTSTGTRDRLYLGAICANSSNGTIRGCTSAVEFIVATSHQITAGGICGLGSGTFDSCTNSGSITLHSTRSVVAGGIVGHLDSWQPSSVCTHLTNHGSITATSERVGVYAYYTRRILLLGGIAGYIGADGTSEFESTNTFQLVNSMNDGTLRAVNTTTPNAEAVACGGIVGSSYTIGLIGNCCNLGTVAAVQDGADPSAGGIIGAWRADHNECYVDVCLTATAPQAYSDGGTAATPGQGIATLDEKSTAKLTLTHCRYPSVALALDPSQATITDVAPLGSGLTPQLLNTLIGQSTYQALYHPW